jgi:hypothetical protein
VAVGTRVGRRDIAVSGNQIDPIGSLQVNAEAVATELAKHNARIEAVETLASKVEKKLDKIIVGCFLAAFAAICDLIARH